MKEDEVAAAIQEAHSIGTAPLFYKNEQALRSVIRFSYISAIDDYQIIQELPSGTGYADMVFIPKKASDKPAMVGELKWNQTANAAISQIKDNDYPEVLKGMADSVLLVAINYDKKTKKHLEKEIDNFWLKLGHMHTNRRYLINYRLRGKYMDIIKT